MKTITINIEDSVLRDLQNNTMLRRLTDNTSINEDFIRKLIDAIKEGKDTLDIAYKKGE